VIAPPKAQLLSAALIDADLLIDLQRGVASPTFETLLGEEDRAISVITVSELLHGVHRATGATRTRRSAFVEHLLAGLRAVPITESVARVHADLWAQLSAQGDTIGAHDLWIGATAVAHGLWRWPCRWYDCSVHTFSGRTQRWPG
jgi:predicted nucleic acid-binding protein